MLPKKGKKLHLDEEDMAFAMMIAEALDTDLGRTHQGVKTAMRWTGASERSVKHWFAGSHEDGLMTASEVAAHLINSCSSLEHFDAYLFGSTLRGIGEDVDILVVGPSGDALSQLKRELQAAGEFLPLHILYMLPSEERRTDFVAREKCVSLGQVMVAVES